MEGRNPKNHPELGLLSDLIQVGRRVSLKSNTLERAENTHQPSVDDDNNDDNDVYDCNTDDGRHNCLSSVSDKQCHFHTHSTSSAPPDTVSVVNEFDDVLLDEKVISIKLYQDDCTTHHSDKSTGHNFNKEQCPKEREHRQNDSSLLNIPTRDMKKLDERRNGYLTTYGSTSTNIVPKLNKKSVNSKRKLPKLTISSAPLVENEITTAGDLKGDNNSCASVSKLSSLKNTTSMVFTFAKGLLSDDDRSSSKRSRVYSTGRRSAPIFSRRAYGSSSFWTSRENVNANVQSASAISPFSTLATTRDSLSPGYNETHINAAKVRMDSKGNACYRNTSRNGYFSEWDAGRGREARNCELLPPPKRQSNILLPRDHATCVDENIDNDEVEWITSNRIDGSSSSRYMTPVHCHATPEPRDGRSVDLFVKKNQNKNNSHKYDTSLAGSISPTHDMLNRLDQIVDPIQQKKQDKTDEKSPLLPSKSPPFPSDAYSPKQTSTKTAAYKKRWYLLLAFSLYNLIWNVVWATWGPIAQSAKAVFSWSDGNIAMFTWLGTLPILVVTFPLAYLMDVKGMRISMVLCCGLTFLGTGLRCISSSPNEATWLNYSGQLLNGVAGAVPLSGAALLSGLWFPASQRATATGISTVSGYLGACFSFIVGPLVVPEPEGKFPINTTNDRLLPAFYQDYTSVNNGTDPSELRSGIMNILYYECGAAGLIFFLVLFYFPSRPDVPPSISASLPREPYVDGLKMLFRNKQFWMTCLAYGVPIGVYEVWQVVLDVILNPRVSQETAGWLDFYGTLGGCLVGLLVSRFADLFTRQIKFFLIVFYLLASGAVLWFNLLVLGVLPFDIVSVYTACIIIGVCLDGSAPLFFELVIEVSYPAGEGVTSGLLQMVVAAAGTVFLSLLQIESLGKGWVNWCFLGCCCLSVPLLVFIKTDFMRANLDDEEVTVDEEDEDDDEVDEANVLDTVVF